MLISITQLNENLLSWLLSGSASNIIFAEFYLQNCKKNPETVNPNFWASEVTNGKEIESKLKPLDTNSNPFLIFTKNLVEGIT